MKYQIDQSGKIEQTERHTVIALTNGECITVFFKKTDKRKLQRIFNLAKMHRLFPYLTFSALVALAIYKMSIKHRIIIDREYAGHEILIKDRIEAYCTLLGMKGVPPLEFGHVGKLSKAHQVAYRVAVKKEKATVVAGIEEVLWILFGTKKSGVGRLTQEWIPGDQRSPRLRVDSTRKRRKVKWI